MKPERQRFAVLAIDDAPANLPVLTAALAADFKVPLSAPFESWPRGGACSCPARVDSINQALHGFTRSAQVLDDQTPLMVELLARNEEGVSHES